MQKGISVNLPLTVNLHIEAFAGGQITQFDSGATNLVYDQYEDGRWYATQRPGINQLEDASASVVKTKGRGGYFWDAVSDRYIVNDDTVYKGSYSGSSMAITAGRNRVFLSDIGDYLAIIDAQNGKGWTISSAAPTVINAITDLDFPPNATPAVALARGGAVLNGKLFVMDVAGTIYESDIENPTAWDALSIREAEVEPDKGVYLAKHHEHIVAFGTRSLEFFQDTANETGSTLSARTDIQYDIGAVNADTHWQVGASLYFVGQDRSGSIGVYRLAGMQVEKISGEDMDSYLTTAFMVDMVGLVGCGFMSGGREFYVLSVFTDSTLVSPIHTLVYGSNSQWWGFWDVQIPGVDLFPLLSWMPSTTTRAGEGVLSNGDLVTVLDTFTPMDTVAASAVYTSDVFEAGMYTATGGSGTAIPFSATTGSYDGGTNRSKFAGDLWLIHAPISDASTLDVQMADNQNGTYGAARSLSVSDAAARLNRNGSFRRRNHRVSGTLSAQIRLENLQFTTRVGGR